MPYSFELQYLLEPCPSCGFMLLQSLQSRTDLKKTKPAISFQSASSIPRLTFDIAKLDDIIQFLRPGQIIGIIGYGSQKLIERLCVRAQLPKKYGGLDSNIVIIDGANSSDPYLSINFARQYGLQVDTVLSRIITSRAFTVYQLWSLVTHELQNVISRYGTKFVVISDLLHMFVDDPFLDKNEANIILQGIINSISKIQDCITIVSISKPTQYDNMVYKLFGRIIKITKQRHRLFVQVDDRKPIQLKESELELIPQR